MVTTCPRLRSWATRLASIVAVSTMLASAQLQAASYSWVASSGDWAIASNWGGTLPTVNDNAYVLNGGTAMVTTLTPSCNNLTVDARRTKYCSNAGRHADRK